MYTQYSKKSFNDFVRFFRKNSCIEEFFCIDWKCLLKIFRVACEVALSLQFLLYQQCPCSAVLVAEARSCISATDLNRMGIMLNDIKSSLSP